MRRIASVAILVTGLLAAGGCRQTRDADPPARAAAPVRVRETRMPMGTYMTMTVYAASQEAGRKAIAAAFARVEEAEAAISTWRKDSDASKVNRLAGGEPVAVDRRLVAVLRRACEVSAETGGAFDVTVGPLVRLYKRCYRRHRLPTEEERAKAMALVGHRAIEVDAEAGTARLSRKRMRVDFGAIGKGYIVDEAVASLRGSGIRAALVDAGGDIYALGSPPGREGWLIGVRDPARPDEIRDERLLVRDRAVATSGDYEQFVVIDGRRCSHILDPRTGRPVEHMTSVTAIAPDATAADAYATACSVFGPEAAVAFAEKRPGVEVMLLHRKGERLAAARSSGFGRFIAPHDAAP